MQTSEFSRDGICVKKKRGMETCSSQKSLLFPCACSRPSPGVRIVNSPFVPVCPADLTAVGRVVRRHVPEAVFLESIGQEITYILPYSGARDGTFALLFKELDLATEDLGLTSYGISDTTLEEVRQLLVLSGRRRSDVPI